MADSTTTTYSFTLPEVGASADSWGTKLNANWSKVDDLFDGTVAVTGINLTTFKVDSVIVTASAAELNKLDGLTATTTELNFVDGVTSNIQTQLDSMVEKAGDTMTGDLSLGDGVKAKFGASDDLQIYHTGSHSFISDVGTGRLYLQGTDGVRVTNASAVNMISAVSGDGVYSYYNGSLKLATTSTGVDVTGTVTADGLTVENSSSSTVANFIYTGGTDAFLGLDGTGTPIYLGNKNGDVVFQTSGSGYADKFRIANNGDVSFYEDTGTTAKMVWDASAESLGIGGAPTTNLTISDTDNPTIRLNNTDTVLVNGQDVGSIEFYTNDPSTGGVGLQAEIFAVTESNYGTNQDLVGLGFSTSLGGELATERMRIDSAGNVGIGTASPSDPLTIQSASNGSSIKLIGRASDGYSTLAFRNSSDTSSLAALFADDSSDSLQIHVNGSERARIDSNGRLGIGSTAPTADLHIKGVNAELDIENNTGRRFRIQSTTANSLSFIDKTVNSERARIDSSGNLLVGTTITDLHTSATEQGARLYDGGIITSGSGTCAYFNRNGTGGNGSIVQFRKDGATVGSIGTYTQAGVTAIGVDGADGIFNIGGNHSTGFQFIDSFGSGQPRFRASLDNSADIGESARRFKDLYLSGGVIAKNTTDSANDLMGEFESGALTTGESTTEVRLTKDGYGLSLKGGLSQGVGGFTTFSTRTPSGSTERMRLDASGNLLVGRTSAGRGQVTIEPSSSNASTHFYSPTSQAGTGANSQVMEGVVYLDTVSSGSRITLPFTSQGNFNTRYLIELRWVSEEYNQSGTGGAGRALISVRSLNTLATSVLESSGNFSSVSSSGTNLYIDVTNAFTGGLNNYEGCNLYYKIIGTRLDWVQIQNLALN